MIVTRDSAMTGMVGVHYIAATLLSREIHAAVTTGNAPNVNVLAGSKEGSATLGIQVKTTNDATRFRGRGNKKAPHHYEFPIGRKSARNSIPGLWFAFVDLKKIRELPDTYIMTSEEVASYFGDEEHKLYRFIPLP